MCLPSLELVFICTCTRSMQIGVHFQKGSPISCEDFKTLDYFPLLSVVLMQAFWQLFQAFLW